MKTNILITSAGKRVALVRYFKQTLCRFYPDAKVFIVDMNPEMAPVSYVCDGAFKVSRCTAPEYPDELIKICEENNVGMVVPTIDTELLLLSELKDKFEGKGIKLITSSMTFMTICRDKRNTSAFFESHGVCIPKEVDKYHPDFPLFAKPYDGSLSTNIHHIKKAEELTNDILHDPKLLFMEYIDKKVYKEYTVDMYYGKDNKVKCIVPRERIEVRAGEINKGRTAKNEIVGFLKEKLGYIEGCVGCICLQLFFNPETKDILGIEINPRFGGGYPLTYMCGGDYPELLIREYFLDENIEYFDDWKDGMLMLRFDDAVFV